jgi:hypothetical protein
MRYFYQAANTQLILVNQTHFVYNTDESHKKQ